MTELADIIEAIRQDLTRKNQVRDLTLGRSRELIRLCALSIRAIHRHDQEPQAGERLTVRDSGSVAERNEKTKSMIPA